jgi:peptide/nickel transport system permease protein
MAAYIIRRMLILFPTLLGVSIIIFFMLHITPGDPAELLLGERASLEALHDLREHPAQKPLTYNTACSSNAWRPRGNYLTRQKVWIDPAEFRDDRAVRHCPHDQLHLGMIFGIISATATHFSTT